MEGWKEIRGRMKGNQGKTGRKSGEGWKKVRGNDVRKSGEEWTKISKTPPVGSCGVVNKDQTRYDLLACNL